MSLYCMISNPTHIYEEVVPKATTPSVMQAEENMDVLVGAPYETIRVGSTDMAVSDDHMREYHTIVHARSNSVS